MLCFSHARWLSLFPEIENDTKINFQFKNCPLTRWILSAYGSLETYDCWLHRYLEILIREKKETLAVKRRKNKNTAKTIANFNSPSSPSPLRFLFDDGGGLRIEVGTRPSCTTCSRSDDELSDVLDTLLLVDPAVTKRTIQKSGAPTQFVSMTSTCCPFCTLSSELPCAAAKSATTHVVSTIPV